MTIKEPDSGVDSGGHPLADSLRRAGSLSSLFNLPVRNPEQDGWLSAPSLFQVDDLSLRDLVTGHGRLHWRTENRHVAGSAFIIAYLTRITWPLISQYVLYRRVPDVRLSNLAFHWNGQGIDGTVIRRPSFAALPADPASNHSDAVVVADVPELYGLLKEWLFEGNLDIVIPSLRRAARASLKVSWNALAASCAQAFHKLYEVADKPEAVVQDAADFFGDPSSPVYREVTMEIFRHQGQQGFYSRRAGCCLWWRTDEAKDYCSNCVLLSREQQDARFRHNLEGRK